MNNKPMSQSERAQRLFNIANIRTYIANIVRVTIDPKYQVKPDEISKANLLSVRKRIDPRSLWLFKAKGSNPKYRGLSMRKRADRLTNKIKVNLGHNALSKKQLKELHAAKHKPIF